MIQHAVVCAVRWLLNEPDATAWCELSVPRWTRPFWKSLEWIDDVPWRLSNVRRFFSAVWYFNSCDWSPSFELLRVALLANAQTFQRGHVVGCERSARECRIAAELIRRLIDGGEKRGTDDYFFWTLDMSRRVYLKSRRRAVPVGDIRGKEYQEMLGALITRKLRTWWD